MRRATRASGSEFAQSLVTRCVVSASTAPTTRFRSAAHACGVRDAGWRSSYIGKWHLSQAVSPDMDAYGFADWEGNDRHFMVRITDNAG